MKSWALLKQKELRYGIKLFNGVMEKYLTSWIPCVIMP